LAVNWLPLEPEELRPGGLARIGGERATHLIRALRAAAGMRLRVLVVGGRRGWGTVREVTAEFVEMQCECDEPPPPPGRVSLLLAMPRPKAARRLWSQLAAMGVRRIVVTGAARIEPSYLESRALDPAEIRRHLVEGLAQSGETRLPEVTVIRRFDRALEVVREMFAGQSTWVADPTRPPLPDPLPPGPAAAAIGPEGGWTAVELSHLEAAGFRGFGLGPRVLRTDTACVAAVALLADATGGAA